jgi:DNA-binding NarL/FixJ family response regulator
MTRRTARRPTQSLCPCCIHPTAIHDPFGCRSPHCRCRFPDVDTWRNRLMDVLHGMADGKSNAEIGRDLFVTEDTVKSHLRHLYGKLGVRQRAHAVALGYQRGYLDREARP